MQSGASLPSRLDGAAEPADGPASATKPPPAPAPASNGAPPPDDE